MSILDPDVDEGDLEFMDPLERMRALGFGDEALVADEAVSTSGNYMIQVPRRKQVPGAIRVCLSEMARDRGLVHNTGQHKGKVQISRIARGTDLAYTTLLPLVSRPEGMALLYTDTLSRLCDFLKCTPGELLKYKPHLATRAVMSDQYKRGE